MGLQGRLLELREAELYPLQIRTLRAMRTLAQEREAARRGDAAAEVAALGGESSRGSSLEGPGAEREGEVAGTGRAGRRKAPPARRPSFGERLTARLGAGAGAGDDATGTSDAPLEGAGGPAKKKPPARRPSFGERLAGAVVGQQGHFRHMAFDEDGNSDPEGAEKTAPTDAAGSTKPQSKLTSRLAAKRDSQRPAGLGGRRGGKDVASASPEKDGWQSVGGLEMTSFFSLDALEGIIPGSSGGREDVLEAEVDQSGSDSEGGAAAEEALEALATKDDADAEASTSTSRQRGGASPRPKPRSAEGRAARRAARLAAVAGSPRADGTPRGPAHGSSLDGSSLDGEAESRATEARAAARGRAAARRSARSPKPPPKRDKAKAPSLDELFDLIDTNGDGELSREEVVAASAKLGMTEAEADSLFDDLDADGNGTLSRGEWSTASFSAGVVANFGALASTFGDFSATFGFGDSRSTEL